MRYARLMAPSVHHGRLRAMALIVVPPRPGDSRCPPGRPLLCRALGALSTDPSRPPRHVFRQDKKSRAPTGGPAASRRAAYRSSRNLDARCELGAHTTMVAPAYLRLAAVVLNM